jgi:hypothetical protein
MGLFDFLKKRPAEPAPPPLVDPVLGPVALDDEWDDGCTWIGDETMFEEKAISISAWGDASGPSDESREVFAELKKRYPTLRTSLIEPLCDNADPTKVGKLDDPADILEVATLTGISVGVGKEIELIYELPWDPEHCYTVFFVDWRVQEVVVD